MVYSGEGSGPGNRRRPAEWDRLELTVRRLLEDYQLQQARVIEAETRIHDLETALESLADGGPDPIMQNERIAALERENQVLRERLDRARLEVERIMARLDFLEEES